jgi:thioesterase domain-containing protein
MVCFEMAQQLHRRGEHVAFVGLIDSYPGDLESSPPPRSLADRARRLVEWGSHHLHHLKLHDARGKWLYVWRRLTQRLSWVWFDRRVLKAHQLAKRTYSPRPFAGSVTLFRGSIPVPGLDPPEDLGWGRLVSGNLDIHVLPGSHQSIVEAYPRPLAQALTACLDRARRETAG